MSVASRDPGAALLALYDDAVGEVYGYLLSRCRNRVVAEDITSEVFMGAVDSVSRGTDPDVTVAWLIGIARHKLVDHWRRLEREQRRIQAVADDPTRPTPTTTRGTPTSTCWPPATPSNSSAPTTARR